jgi:hypothetical protein
MRVFLDDGGGGSDRNAERELLAIEPREAAAGALRRWRHVRTPRPDQDAALLIARELLGGDQFFLEHGLLLIPQTKRQSQSTRGHPSSAAEELDHLIKHRVEVHHRPSICASAASAWGSQNVISIARYRSMAVERSARASSRRPVLAYNRPRPR